MFGSSWHDISVAQPPRFTAAELEHLASLIAAALVKHGAPPLNVAPTNTGWTRWLSTGQAARLVGITEDALRARIWAQADSDGCANFDGVEARRLGRNYRVRLDERWFPGEGAGAGRLAR